MKLSFICINRLVRAKRAKLRLGSLLERLPPAVVRSWVIAYRAMLVSCLMDPMAAVTERKYRPKAQEWRCMSQEQQQTITSMDSVKFWGFLLLLGHALCLFPDRC